MGVIIAFSNQKGGVGKTTSVVNLAGALGRGGNRILVIDGDPQGNASSVLVPAGIIAPSLFEGKNPSSTCTDQVALFRTQHRLDDESSNSGRSDRHELRRRLDAWKTTFDFIFIDCPPNLSFLPTSALIAADWLVVPLQCEYFAMEGLGQLLAHVESLREEGSCRLELAGILLTMHDSTHRLSQQVQADARAHFSERVFRNIIPRDIALAAAPSHRQTIDQYAPLSPGALAYLGAAKELLHALG